MRIIVRSLTEFYNEYGLALYHLCLDYQAGHRSLKNVQDFFEEFPKFKRRDFRTWVAVFEGERCVGKDTVISCLREKGVLKDVCILDRKVDNPSWRLLNEKKRNCYFKLGDPIESVLLWISDLCYRMSVWHPSLCSAKYAVINRYTLSLEFCILSNYEKSIPDWQYGIVTELLRKGMMIFPKPDLTFLLEARLGTIQSRMLSGRKREFTEEEIGVTLMNIDRFHAYDDDTCCHIETDRKLEYVLEDICRIFNRWMPGSYFSKHDGGFND